MSTENVPAAPNCFRCGSQDAPSLVAVKLKASTAHECKDRAACHAQHLRNQAELRRLANG